MIKNIFTKLNTLLILSFIFVPLSADSARLYFEPEEVLVRPGDKVESKLMLELEEGENINALEISFEQFKYFSSFDSYFGDSFVVLWLERPQITNSVISLAGTIPGGFTGILDASYPGQLRPGVISTFVFSLPEEGEFSLDPKDVILVENSIDQEQISVSFNSLKIYVDNEYATSTVDILDNIAPDEFEVEIIENFPGTDGEAALVFSTQDNLSGVDYYEVSIGNEGWERVESPYFLNSADLNQEILIKAVDKSGNVRIVSVYNEKRSGVTYLFILVIVLVLITGLIIFRRVFRKK